MTRVRTWDTDKHPAPGLWVRHPDGTVSRFTDRVRLLVVGPDGDVGELEIGPDEFVFADLPGKGAWDIHRRAPAKGGRRAIVMAALSRLIANAFGGREAKLSIPAEESDDDLLVSRAVRQLFDEAEWQEGE